MGCWGWSCSLSFRVGRYRNEEHCQIPGQNQTTSQRVTTPICDPSSEDLGMYVFLSGLSQLRWSGLSSSEGSKTFRVRALRICIQSPGLVKIGWVDTV